jgi:hypothetical protein
MTTHPGRFERFDQWTARVAENATIKTDIFNNLRLYFPENALESRYIPDRHFWVASARTMKGRWLPSAVETAPQWWFRLTPAQREGVMKIQYTYLSLLEAQRPEWSFE